ncbi:MAG: hypothetical protein ACUVX9_08785 [Anaerolineae bacterium]
MEQEPRRRDEKDEKEEEKEREKREEKGRGTSWRADGLSAAVWALILIWAGLVLLADNTGYLVRSVGWPAWALITIGAGIILLAEVALRLLVPSLRRPIGGTVVLAIVLIAIGLADKFSWQIILPIALVAIGVILLLRALVFRR